MDAVGALDVYFQDRDDIDVGSAPEKVRSRKACLGFTAWDFSIAAAIRPSPSNRRIYRADEVVTTTPALTPLRRSLDTALTSSLSRGCTIVVSHGSTPAWPNLAARLAVYLGCNWGALCLPI
jgi:hypothetical protein